MGNTFMRDTKQSISLLLLQLTKQCSEIYNVGIKLDSPPLSVEL